MTANQNVLDFLSSYPEEVCKNAWTLREVVFENLPDVIEQIDLSAKMIAYGYGQKYSELVCVIIPSKKGLKLGFNKGTDLPDPENLLEGTGKISRYVILKSETQITSQAIKQLLENALEAYRLRNTGSVLK
jgi:hypothetical protein